MNVKLEYWNGEFWESCGSFFSESNAWMILGKDNENYRTFCTVTRSVLTDASTDLAKFEQYSVLVKSPDVCKLMMARLKKIEAACFWAHPWSKQIEVYNLSHEVSMSSGLTDTSCAGLSDENFLQLVSSGMAEWDL